MRVERKLVIAWAILFVAALGLIAFCSPPEAACIDRGQLASECD